jgi:tetratricopeptide (TPR) repeat protein
VLLEANRPAEAVGFFRAALVMRPESSAVHDRLALALCRQGLVEEALEAYRKAIELDQAGRLPHRYNAARAALSAARPAGSPGSTAGRPRAGLRRQALAWFRAELGLWARRLDGGKAEDRFVAARTLDCWLHDRDLAGVRDPEALVSLPEAERPGWRQLWADVEALWARAGGGVHRQGGG